MPGTRSSSRRGVAGPKLRHRQLACAVAAGIALFAGAAGPAQAASFAVNTTSDAADATPGDGVCQVAGPPSTCSLRAAIEETQALPGADTITFSLSAPATIQLTGPLPDIATDTQISGPGAQALTVRRDSGGDYRIFTITDATVGISGLTMANGRVTADEGGGAILNAGTLTLDRVAVTGNAVVINPAPPEFLVVGGGVNNSGTMTVTRSTITGNSLTITGSGRELGFGAGIASGGPALAISDSTVNGNALSVTADAAIAAGGGIAMEFGSNAVTNVTVTANTATATGTVFQLAYGGGIAAASNGTTTITGATIAFNAATVGANVATSDNAVIRLRDSIVADPQTGPNCMNVFVLASAIVSDGFNLDSDATCGLAAAGDQSGVDPLLAPLADNGGPVPTHAIAAGSPALDQGSAAASGGHPALAADARGKPRPADLAPANAAGGDGTDVGAFELQPPAPAGYAPTILADTPAGYWRFGEASGTTAVDSSPNHNDGLYRNGPLLGQAGALAGDPNTAASFDGVNDLVSVPDSGSLDVGDSFTVEGWVKRTSASSSVELFNKGSGGLQLTVMNAANGNQVWLRKASVTTIARSTSGVPADGRFHHVVVTKNGAAVAIYIDGSSAGAVVLAPAQVIANTASPLTFAGPSSARYVFDEFALYDAPLSATAVAAHYAAGVGPI
jgi:CSLREA domain-containing protein